MKARTSKILGITVAILLAIVGIAFPIWISASVGDPRIGNPESTIVTIAFIALVIGLVAWRMRRDNHG